MRTNPFLDAWLFLTGETATHAAIGQWRYLFTAFSAALVLGSVAVAIASWRGDPAQRTSRHVAIWLARALIGMMWLEGSLWKLPLPAGGGLPYWLGLMSKNAAFDSYGNVIGDVLIPNAVIICALIWLTETTLAISLLLGVAVRLTSLLGIAMAVNLWIGLYRYQPEWPWIYVFVGILHMFFIINRAGRSLGLDALAGARIRLALASVPFLQRIYTWAS